MEEVFNIKNILITFETFNIFKKTNEPKFQSYIELKKCFSHDFNNACTSLFLTQRLSRCFDVNSCHAFLIRCEARACYSRV